MAFEDLSVVITGASRGIGRQIALFFAEHGHHPLVLIARDPNGLAETRQACEERGARHVYTIECNLSDPKELGSVILPEPFNHVGVLVNNAGGYAELDFSESDAAVMHEQFDANVMTAFNAIKHFAPMLMQNNRGYVITVGSLGGLKGLERAVAYATSKHALLGLCRSLRPEFARHNIGVTVVNPGATWSTSWEDEEVIPENLIDARDVARLIYQVTRISPRSVVDELLITPMRD